MWRTLTIAVALPGLAVLLWAATSLGPITATPPTVSFRSSDPDAGPVAGTPVTVTWTAYGGSRNRTWNITVRANSSTLSNCATVPSSAIRARCTSATVTSGGSGSCSQAFPLGISGQQVAGGNEGQQTGDYTVNITYEFTDSWKYKGATSPACSLNLTYVVTAQ